MSKPHLPNDEFFSFLESLLVKQSASSRGSVFLTQKRLQSGTTSKDESQPTESNPPMILIRASNGRHKDSKVKASTVVKPEEIEAFYRRYAEICKAGMVGLKKRDRSAKKKGKAKGKK
ncbi:signal recognition particle 14kD protein [Trichophyton violaceum]|uniref:Signal recognition particle subunit SRP14 n=1 Tax=Trichophyton violaceum TaxID=34388 RepID=A0A178FIL5_TRIVO|nr:signal recognition particle 14kD protein [Trichophyton violaceum]